jgi:hypothetical protein
VIEEYQFGSMKIGGKRYRNDLKIVGGKVIPDWWRREGHSVEEADVDDVIAAKPGILVVGMGDPGRMQVTDPLRSALAGAGIRLIEEPTATALRTFNRLSAEGKNVAGAFHLTC